MKITYSDGLGLVEVEVDESGIVCDGYRFVFDDTEGREVCVLCSNVLNIMP